MFYFKHRNPLEQSQLHTPTHLKNPLTHSMQHQNTRKIPTSILGIYCRLFDQGNTDFYFRGFFVAFFMAFVLVPYDALQPKHSVPILLSYALLSLLTHFLYHVYLISKMRKGRGKHLAAKHMLSA